MKKKTKKKEYPGNGTVSPGILFSKVCVITRELRCVTDALKLVLTLGSELEL